MKGKKTTTNKGLLLRLNTLKAYSTLKPATYKMPLKTSLVHRAE